MYVYQIPQEEDPPNYIHELTDFRPDDAAYDGQFGSAIALSGTTALIGSGDEPAAYLYSLADPCNPAELAKLTPPDEAVALEYATKVDIAGNVAVVGARDDTEAADRAGAVYLYDISDPTNPSYLAKLMASDAARFDKLGTSVACTEDLVLGGAPGWQSGETWRGAGYVFIVPEPATILLLGLGGLGLIRRRRA